MIRFARNALGYLQGYGACYRCGDSWAWKEPHTIWFGRRGMFPICEECWQATTTSERHAYADRLIARWQEFGHVAPEEIAAIHLAIEASVGYELMAR